MTIRLFWCPSGTGTALAIVVESSHCGSVSLSLHALSLPALSSFMYKCTDDEMRNTIHFTVTVFQSWSGLSLYFQKQHEERGEEAGGGEGQREVQIKIDLKTEF